MNEFIYTVKYSEEDEQLAELELRSFFGTGSKGPSVKSGLDVEVNRSPFIREKLAVMLEAETSEELIQQSRHISAGENTTFKVVFIKTNDLHPDQKATYEERMRIERAVGWEINGEADLKHPDRVYGVVPYKGRWYLGIYEKNERVWTRHVKKPREYSTALSARDARAIINIAVPHPEGVRAIDPCCGIGTVLVEARSMGIDIQGRDINPLVVDGSRENLAHFGLNSDVEEGPIEEAAGCFDAAVIDMPYNLYTRATPEELQSILTHARRITKKLVVVSTDSVEKMVEQAGFVVADRAVARKGIFSRRILVCL